MRVVLHGETVQPIDIGRVERLEVSYGDDAELAISALAAALGSAEAAEASLRVQAAVHGIDPDIREDLQRDADMYDDKAHLQRVALIELEAGASMIDGALARTTFQAIYFGLGKIAATPAELDAMLARVEYVTEVS